MGSPTINAPGAVEDGDALLEDLLALGAGVIHEFGSRLKRSGAGGPRAL